MFKRMKVVHVVLVMVRVFQNSFTSALNTLVTVGGSSSISARPELRVSTDELAVE